MKTTENPPPTLHDAQAIFAAILRDGKQALDTIADNSTSEAAGRAYLRLAAARSSLVAP